jgi:hypothetical protein
MAGSGETTMLFTTWRRRVKAAVNRKDGTLHCLILILMEDEPPCRLLWAVTQRHFLETIFVLFQCRITNANGSNALLFRLWVHKDAARRYGMMSVWWHLRGGDRTCDVMAAAQSTRRSTSCIWTSRAGWARAGRGSTVEMAIDVGLVAAASSCPWFARSSSICDSSLCVSNRFFLSQLVATVLLYFWNMVRRWNDYHSLAKPSNLIRCIPWQFDSS